MLPGTDRQLVEFPSYEAAMANSQHLGTVASAERLSKLANGESGFCTLDIIHPHTP
jgi:hypothetical protein